MDLLIDIGISQNRLVVLDKNKPKKIFLEDCNSKSISGNIYKGKVKSMINSLDCAFVDIGERKKGLLHFTDCIKPIKLGDEVLVQVIREPIGEKGARLSMDISLSSKNIVLLINSNEINISRKITDKSRRKELLDLSKKIVKDNLGIIFRTQSEFLLEEDIISEYNHIKKVWENIISTWKYVKGEKALYKINDFLDNIKKEYINNNIEKIYINRENEKKNILEYINENNYNIELKSIEESVSRNKDIVNFIKGTLNRKFETEKGSNIVVDETEALTVIDVNSSSLKEESNIEKNSLCVNLASISKISEVIALRNLSGIIFIDFINMKSKDSRVEVINSLEESFLEFNIKAKIHKFTTLGILEISKAKKGKRLKDHIYIDNEQTIENPLYIIKNLENDILGMLYQNNKSSFDVNIGENIYNEINNISFIKNMLTIYGVKLKTNVISEINGYNILERDKSNFARISIGDRKIFGEIEDFSEDEKLIHLKVKKQIKNNKNT